MKLQVLSTTHNMDTHTCKYTQKNKSQLNCTVYMVYKCDMNGAPDVRSKTVRRLVCKKTHS